MFRSNDMEPYKITLVGWVDQAFEQWLVKKIKSRFRNIGIWAFNLNAMDGKTWPLEVHTITKVTNVENEEDYTTKEEAKNTQQWGEEFVVVELFHIIWIVQHPTFEDLPTYMLKND